MDRILDSVEKYLLYIVVLAIGLSVIPLFPNPYDTAKIFVLFILLSLIILVKGARTFLKGSLEVTGGTFDLPILLLVATYLLSAFLRTPNKMEAFLLPGTASVVAGGALLYLLLNQSVQKKLIARLAFVSGVLIAAISLLAASGLLAKIPQLPAYVKDTLFSPIGGLFPTVLFLAALLPIGIVLLINEKEIAKKFFWTVSLAVLILGLGLAIYRILPGKPASPSFAGFGSSWAISVDTLKESPILGIGPGNYLSAFNRLRPIAYNSTNLWAVRFASAQDFFLTNLTETGLLGFAAFVLLLWLIFKTLRTELVDPQRLLTEEGSYLASLVVAIVILLIFPATMPFLLLTFVLLALAAKTRPMRVNLSAYGTASEVNFQSRAPALLLVIPAVIAVLALGYFGGRAFLAEYRYSKALNSLAANDAQGTYNTLISAIDLNPNVDRYHATYAQVNLALAGALAQKKDITDNDKATVSQLIQQAIREAKATVSLNPTRSGNWELLARTYQSIMAFAQGSDQFAIQSFAQAVALDPINPNLRIALGGVYYALGRYDEAINSFQLATFAKPDLANAHYNLSAAYREKGDIEKAIPEMTTVLSLVQKDSNDYNTAKAELEALEKKRPAKQAQGSENLTAPQKAKEPVIKPPLTLPQESTPPATP